MDEDRRVQASLFHLHLESLHILSSLLPPKVLNILLVVHTNRTNVLHVIHIENVLVQMLRNHSLLQNVHRHSTATLIKVVLIPRERAVIREFLIEIPRVQTRLRHLLLQVLNRLSQNLQVEETNVLRVDGFLPVDPSRCPYNGTLDVLRSSNHVVHCYHNLLPLTPLQQRYITHTVERHSRRDRRGLQNESRKLLHQLPRATASVVVCREHVDVAQNHREVALRVLLFRTLNDGTYQSRHPNRRTEKGLGTAQIDVLHNGILPVITLALHEESVLLLDILELTPLVRRRSLDQPVHNGDDVPVHEDASELRFNAPAIPTFIRLNRPMWLSMNTFITFMNDSA